MFEKHHTKSKGGKQIMFPTKLKFQLSYNFQFLPTSPVVTKTKNGGKQTHKAQHDTTQAVCRKCSAVCLVVSSAGVFGCNGLPVPLVQWFPKYGGRRRKSLGTTALVEDSFLLSEHVTQQNFDTLLQLVVLLGH